MNICLCNSFGAHKPNSVLRPLCYMNCLLFCCWRLWKIEHPNMLYNAICFWMFFDVSYSNKNDLIWFDLRHVCLFVSLLSHFWLIHLFYLHLLYQPYVGLCQATRVQSHQRQSTSAVAIATCEVQVSAADYQTVPTVATGVSKPLCCRLTLTFTLTSENLSLYITLLL